MVNPATMSPDQAKGVLHRAGVQLAIQEAKWAATWNSARNPFEAWAQYAKDRPLRTRAHAAYFKVVALVEKSKKRPRQKTKYSTL